MALSWTLDKVGPFGRSADDCGLILQVIAGKDAKDPGSAGKSFYYTPQYARPLKDLKIGYAPVDFADRAEPSARPAFAAALAVLKDSGAQMVETKLPDFPYGPVLSLILNAEMGSIFEPLITSGKVDELADKPQIAGLKASLDVPAKDYLKAMRIRRLIQAEFSRLFGEIDILLAPGRPGPPSGSREPRCARLRAPGERPRGIPRHHPGRQSGGTARAGDPVRVRRATCPWLCNSWACRSRKTRCWRSAGISSPAPTGTSAGRRCRAAVHAYRDGGKQLPAPACV